MDLLGLFHYWVFAILLMTGFYAVLNKPNYIKKLVGLTIFQSAVFLLYVSMGRIDGGTAPILLPEASQLGTHQTPTATATVYSNPLPQVLILTAIVVGISTLALGLAIVVRIQEAFGTLEGDQLLGRASEDDGA